MKYERNYPATRFNVSVLQAAVQRLGEVIPEGDSVRLYTMSVTSGHESWTFDTLEEFLSEYRRDHSSSHLNVDNEDMAWSYELTVWEADGNTNVTVQAPGRAAIISISGVFEEHAEESRIPAPPALPPEPPRLFIGHGRSTQWRELKDHLHDSHGYAVEAFEVGARAGHTIRDILEEMLSRSSFALLVHTAEDETAEGLLRARQNVIHETGLFQGRLGFSRAIVLLEEGTEDYSNLQGVQQIRYGRGNIRETYGEVLATLRREFG